ncbi:MAG: hypothetical protein ACRCXT_13155 [Paraclostridium sp.]
MRDPFNMKVNNDRTSVANMDTLTIKVNDIPEYDKEPYDLNDPKDFKRYIYDIKRSVRNSFEYRQMVSFLRDNMEMNKCSFYENVNNIDSFKVKIHLHHHPFTLEDIASIVYRKRLFFGELLHVEMVSQEVMFLHYLLYVGLIPLAETVHELVHGNYIFIPLDKVLGNFRQFEQTYGDFMDAEQKDKYQRNEEFSKIFIENTIDILDTKYVYIDTTGSYKLPPLQEVLHMVEDKLAQIRRGENIQPVEQYNQIEKKIPKPLYVKIDE